MYVFLMSSQVMLMLLAQGHTLQITILRNLFLERVNHLESSLAIKVGDQARGIKQLRWGINGQKQWATVKNNTGCKGNLNRELQKVLNNGHSLDEWMSAKE